jgi:phage-related protein (TIGR01555 family)
VSIKLIDSLKNFVANLGTDRDKAASSSYEVPLTEINQLVNAYRGSWLARKIVDIPALDSTRKWRSWQASKDQITLIDAEEKRLGIKQKILEARIKSRLFGGAGVYIGIKNERDPSLPLDPATVQKQGIDFLSVLPMRILQAGELETDPISPNYGNPKYYQVSSSAGMATIHPSRIVRFIGAPMPDDELAHNQGWGDSVLTAAWSACKNFDATIANIASLVFESKVDILGIPNLSEIMADKQQRDLLVERIHLAATLKGNNGMLIRDAEETHDSKTFAFAGLENVSNIMSQSGSGAADIPMTRLFGQSPGGMNSSGESDLRNYYDRIQSAQELEIAPAMNVLDECVIRSALGARPAEIHYVWNSLWQTTDKERADIGKTVADTIKTLADSQLFNPDVLSAAAENLLIERAVMPGLESAIERFGAIENEEESDNDNPESV